MCPYLNDVKLEKHTIGLRKFAKCKSASACACVTVLVGLVRPLSYLHRKYRGMVCPRRVFNSKLNVIDWVSYQFTVISKKKLLNEEISHTCLQTEQLASVRNWINIALPVAQSASICTTERRCKKIWKLFDIIDVFPSSTYLTTILLLRQVCHK